MLYTVRGYLSKIKVSKKKKKEMSKRGPLNEESTSEGGILKRDTAAGVDLFFCCSMDQR